MNVKNNYKTAFVFPGIGVKLSGYEREIYNRYKSIYSPLLSKGSEKTGINLEDILNVNSVHDLDELSQQIFIFCFSAGTFRVLSEKNIQPSISAGYSFGIYNALYASNGFSFNDGIVLLSNAFSCIKKVCLSLGKNIHTSVIIGLPIDIIESLLQQDNYSSVAHINSNNEICHIISGNREEMLDFNNAVRKEGALNVVDLDTTQPYHHPKFSGKSYTMFQPYINTITWNEPVFPIISTINQKILTTADELKSFVADHLISPINLYKTSEYLCDNYFDPIIECGPGISLTQNGRFIPNKARWINIKNCSKQLGI